MNTWVDMVIAFVYANRILTQEWIGGYGCVTHPGMNWWVWLCYSPRNEFVGMVGVTHLVMSLWVWWGYSPSNELVGMVVWLTQEWVCGCGFLTQEWVGWCGCVNHPGMSLWVWVTHPGMSLWVWWGYSPRNEFVGMVGLLTQEWVGGCGCVTHPGMGWSCGWYSPRNGLVGVVVTHPGKNWWVWWDHSSGKELEGMVGLITQE